MEHHEQQIIWFAFVIEKILTSNRSMEMKILFSFYQAPLMPFYTSIDVFISILKLKILIKIPFKRSKR